jgi:hypothetical protein
MSELSRRQSLLKIAAAFNGVVGVLLGIPIVRYVLSPMRQDYDRWIPLATLDQFPTGETRLATFRSPVSNRHRGASMLGAQCRWEQVSGLRDQLRAPGLSRAVVSAVALIHVPVSRRCLLRGRLARVGPA